MAISHVIGSMRGGLGMGVRSLGASALLALLVAGLLLVAVSEVSAEPPTPAELRPTGLSVALVDGVVTLGWAEPTADTASITGYQVLRREPGVDPVGQFAVIADNTGTSATSYEDRSATRSSWTYRVKARRGDTLSNWSNYNRINLPDSYTTPPPVVTPTPDPPPVVTPTPDPPPVVTPTPDPPPVVTPTPDPPPVVTPTPDPPPVVTPTPDPPPVVTPTPDPPPVVTPTPVVVEVSSVSVWAPDVVEGTVGVGGHAIGVLDVDGERDWFEVRLVAGTAYQVDMHGSWSGGYQWVDGSVVWVSAGSLHNPKLLGVYDHSGTLVAGSDNETNGVGFNSRIETLTVDTDGTYYIKAGSEADSGTGTYAISVHPLGPAAPVLAATAVLDDEGVGRSVALTWEAQTGAGSDITVNGVTLPGPDTATATGYRIQRADSGGPFATITDTGASATAYADTAVTPGRTYTYRIAALVDQAQGEPSNTVAVELPGASSTKSDNGDSGDSVLFSKSVDNKIEPVVEQVSERQVVSSAVGGFLDVDAGWGHRCALRTDGTITCWGTMKNRRDLADSPEGIFTQIAAGNDRSCGVRADGSVSCWTRPFNTPSDSKPKQQLDTKNYLGVCWLNQDTTLGCREVRGGSPSGSGFQSITVGSNMGCALNADDEAVCWQNGLVKVPSGTFKFLQAGGFRVCGIRLSDDTDIDGTVVCWKYGGSGSSAREYTLDENNPPVDKFVQVDTHYRQTCGVTESNDIKCWVGTGSDTWLTQKMNMVPPAGVIASVSTDWYYYACALKTDSTISCWNYKGEEISTPSFDSPWRDNAKLLGLTISDIDLDFDRDTLTYTATVANSVSAVTVTPEATNNQASWVISPADDDTSADGHQVNLTVGSNTVTVTVTSADGENTQIYTVTITRSA